MHVILGTLLVVLGLLAAVVPVAIVAAREPGWGSRAAPAGVARPAIPRRDREERQVRVM
jgi:hypothetical protein